MPEEMIDKTTNKTIKELLKKKSFLEKEKTEYLVKIKELEEEKEKKEQALNQFLAEKKAAEEKKALQESLKEEFEKIIEQEEGLKEKTKELEEMMAEEKDPQKSQELRWNRWQAGKQRRDVTAKKQDLEKEIERIRNQIQEAEEKAKESNLPKLLEEISSTIAQEKRKLAAKTGQIEEIEREIIAEKNREEERQKEEERRAREEEERKRLEEERKVLEELERKKEEERKKKEEEGEEESRRKQEEERRKVAEEEKIKQEEEQKRKEEEEKRKEIEEEERRIQEIKEKAKIKQQEEKKKDEEGEKKEELSNLLNRAISLYEQKRFEESLVEFKKIIQEAEKVEPKPGFLAIAFGKTILSQARKYRLMAERDLEKEKQEKERPGREEKELRVQMAAVKNEIKKTEDGIKGLLGRKTPMEAQINGLKETSRSLSGKIEAIAGEERKIEEEEKDVERRIGGAKDADEEKVLEKQRIEKENRRRQIKAEKWKYEEELEKTEQKIKEITLGVTGLNAEINKLKEKINARNENLKRKEEKIEEVRKKIKREWEEKKKREQEQIEREEEQKKQEREKKRREEEKKRQEQEQKIREEQKRKEEERKRKEKEEEEREVQEIRKRAKSWQKKHEEERKKEGERRKKEEEQRKKQIEEEERMVQEIRKLAGIKHKEEEERKKKQAEEEKRKRLFNLLNQAISFYNQKKLEESLVEFKKIIQEAEKVEPKPGLLSIAFGKTILSQARKYRLMAERALEKERKEKERKQKEAERMTQEELKRKRQEEERRAQEEERKRIAEEERKKIEEARRKEKEEQKRREEQKRKEEEEGKEKEKAKKEEEKKVQEIRKLAGIKHKEEEERKKKQAEEEKRKKEREEEEKKSKAQGELKRKAEEERRRIAEEAGKREQEQERKEQEQKIREEQRRKEEEMKRKEIDEEERMVQEIRKRAEVRQKEKEKEIKVEKKEEKEMAEKRVKEKWKETLTKIKRSEIWSEFAAVTRYPVVGIDISDHSVEVLNLDPQGKLLAYGRSVLKEGLVQDGVILDQKKLVDILKETFKNTEPISLALEPGTEIKAVVSLPESKTYIQYFVFKEKNNLYQKIQKRVQETVPIPFGDLYFDFLQTGTAKEEIKVLCVVAKQEIIGSYIYLLRVAGITPIVLDTESASIARALLPEAYDPLDKKEKKAGENTMILDIGARTTVLGVHNKEGKMCLALSMPYAGTYFTRKVVENFNLSFEEAEEKKINQGFREGSEVLPVLEKASQRIIDEAKEAVKFYEMEFGEKITKIILAGGSALLPEIDLFFQKHFDAKIEIGNPLLKIKAGESLDRKKGILYASVIGLALRGISRDPVKAGINLLPEEIKTKERKTQRERQKSALFGAIFFAVAGLLLLAATISYIAFFPVPSEMQPLKHRILMIVPQEKEEVVTVRIKEEFIALKIPLFTEPSEEAEMVVEVTAQDVLELIEEKENWLKVRAGDKEGWIEADYIDIFVP